MRTRVLKQPTFFVILQASGAFRFSTNVQLDQRDFPALKRVVVDHALTDRPIEQMSQPRHEPVTANCSMRTTRRLYGLHIGRGHGGERL